MNAPRNKMAELRAALATMPATLSKGDRQALCDRFDVDSYELSRMISRVRLDPMAGTGPRRTKKDEDPEIVEVGSEMAKGRGDRHETCVNYSECLGAWTKATHLECHCPVKCTRFEAMNREAELQERARSGRAAA